MTDFLPGVASIPTARHGSVTSSVLDSNTVLKKQIIRKLCGGMHMRQKRASFILLAAGIATFSGQIALAQQGEAVVLEEITVTAQRIEQNLQSVPVAVTALTGDYLEKFNLRNVTALDSAAPNLSFAPSTGGGSSQVSAFIRGVGEFDFLLTTDPAVGVYVDGVFLARTFGSNLELADVERVEVLRGPQGTLFGKNNIGGAISLTTKRPTGSGDGRIEASVGNYDTLRLDAYGDFRLTDQLAIGVSVLHRRSDGWQKRPHGENGGKEDRWAGRLTLAWGGDDGFESRFSLDGATQSQPSNANVMIAYNPAGLVAPFLPLFNAFVVPTTPCCTPPRDKDRSGAQGPLVRDDMDAVGATWINEWQVNDGTQIKSITAFRKMRADFGRDGDNSFVNYNGDVHDERHWQFSEELQASGDAGWVNWVAGLYYLKERTRDHTQLVTAHGLFDALSAFGDSEIEDLFNLYLARYALDFNLDFRNRQTTEDYAVYINGEFPFTERLSLQAGLRYTHEKKDFSQFVIRSDSQRSLFLPINPFTGEVDTSNVSVPSSACSDLKNEGTFFTCHSSWNELSPRVSLNFQWTPDVFAYAQISRGFRSGGMNGRPTNISLIQDYKPEHLNSAEIGLKTLFADRRVRLNTAAFYNQYEDMQVLLTRGTTIIIANAAKAIVYGVEMDLEAALTSAWSMRASVGYVHNEYEKWRDDLGDYTWRNLRNAPEWTANFGTTYDLPLANAAHLRFGASVAYLSSMYLDGENSPVLHAPSRTLVDASVFYVAPDERWEIGIQGSNLTDKRVLNSGYNALQFFGYAEGYYNPPRRYWLTYRYRI